MVDGVNLSQTTVSAIQNVAAVTKQIEQYKTQLQQYQIMLRNSAAPADYIWSQADQTISMLLAAQDTLSYYKTQSGSLEKYFERYQDTAHYESAPCIGSDACVVSDQQAIAQAQKEASGVAPTTRSVRPNAQACNLIVPLCQISVLFGYAGFSERSRNGLHPCYFPCAVHAEALHEQRQAPEPASEEVPIPQ